MTKSHMRIQGESEGIMGKEEEAMQLEQGERDDLGGLWEGGE